MENVFLKKRRGFIPIKSGFTLLEILIVIAIIGILVSLGVVSYSSAQKKARNSKRRGDVKAIQNAWEQYYADNSGLYPANCNVNMSTYLPGGLPTDPKGGAYVPPTCTTSTYCFCGALEGETGNSNAACGSGAATTHFCVSQLQ